MTLQTKSTGTGNIIFGLGASAHTLWLNNVKIFKGCTDAFYRRYENGLVLLNACSKQAVSFDLAEIDPDNNYRKLKGLVDPVHNSGELVQGIIEVAPLDAIFLKRI